ncbi:MAG TPA: HlyC/CorC family transporter [Crocinitomix sp.]|nr:HlyC/CorC family transporter [Crocinitomix sp.]
MNSIFIISTLVASAFFSGIEIAFISANRLKIELDKKQGNLSGKILSYFVKHESKFISAMLLGNNVSLVLYGIYMAKALEPSIAYWVNNGALILLTQTVISTLIVLVTAEFIPKAIFSLNPNRTLSIFAPIVLLVYILLFIPTYFTTIISNGFLKLFKMDISNSQTAFTKTDLDDFVRDINARIEDEAEMVNEIQILHNALDFNKTKVRDCMIPRTEIIALNINNSIEDLKQKFIETGLSKIIIYKENIDDVVGYVHAFELFKKPKTIKQILLPISITPEASLIQDILEQFTKLKRSVAIVVDEFGGTSGLITVEDIIEEIFGEIEDEHDSEKLIEEEITDKKFRFSARHEIDYIQEKYGIEFQKDDEYTTLAGFVLNQLEEIPKKGDHFKYNNYYIEISKVSDNRVEEIVISIED